MHSGTHTLLLERHTNVHLTLKAYTDVYKVSHLVKLALGCMVYFASHCLWSIVKGNRRVWPSNFFLFFLLICGATIQQGMHTGKSIYLFIRRVHKGVVCVSCRFMKACFFFQAMWIFITLDECAILRKKSVAHRSSVSSVCFCSP